MVIGLLGMRKELWLQRGPGYFARERDARELASYAQETRASKRPRLFRPGKVNVALAALDWEGMASKRPRLFRPGKYGP